MRFLGWGRFVIDGRAVFLEAAFRIENATLTYPCCMN